MPAIQPYILEPIWEQFCALLPEREVNHPLGCHGPRIPNRVVFEKLVQVLVFGCAYWRIADEKCSATTLRRRREEWIEAGVMDELRELVVESYDRILGLELTDLAVDCCITKAPCGGEMAARSPVNRGKGGIKRSMVVDACGIPLGIVIAPANRHDSPLLDDTLNSLRPLGELADRTSVHLDRAYDSDTIHQKLVARGLRAEISEKSKPAPIMATKRWVVERASSWQNAHKKLAWCTERKGRVIAFWVTFSEVIIIVRRLIRKAWTHYRWESRPSRRP